MCKHVAILLVLMDADSLIVFEKERVLVGCSDKEKVNEAFPFSDGQNIFFRDIFCTIFRGKQNKKPFEIILHVGRVTSLQSWVAKRSCHSQTLINECSRLLTTLSTLLNKLVNISQYINKLVEIFLKLSMKTV